MGRKINVDDFSKKPYNASEYADMRGVVDWGNLLQFAPYESGYCFLAVINGPYLADQVGGDFKELQDAFIKILEQEFKGLSGIENISAETIDMTDGISTMSLLGKVTQTSNSTITMDFTEKSGSLITKYVSTYLRYIRDPKTQVKTYGGYINSTNSTKVNPYKEVFNFLYIITDSTCLNIEKAFLLLNAQPMEAAYGDLYNMNKGEISTKDISVNFNTFVVDGKLANKLALVYMRSLVNTGAFKKNKINTNSYEMDWSISGIEGKVINSSKLFLGKKTKNGVVTYKFDTNPENFDKSIIEGKNNYVQFKDSFKPGDKYAGI